MTRKKADKSKHTKGERDQTHRGNLPRIEITAPPQHYASLHHHITQQNAPPSVLVGPDDGVVHLAADAGRYLVQPPGPMTTNVFALVRQELRGGLHTAIPLARRELRATWTRSVAVRFNGETRAISLAVQPALESEHRGFVVVTFNEHTSPAVAHAEGADNIDEAPQTADRDGRRRFEELDRLTGDLHSLLVSTDIATLFLDRDLRVLHFTPKLKELFKIGAIDHGRLLSDFAKGPSYEAMVGDARRVLELRAPIERPLRCPDGQWFLVRIVPYRDDGDRIAGVVATFVNITAQKAAEEALRESHRHKDEFLAMLGHELRNPLAAIRSATELLSLREGQEPSTRSACGVLERQSVYMARIIDGLLDLSRIAQGKIHLEMEVIDLRGVLDGVLDGRAPQMLRRGLELRSNVSSHALWVHGDATRLAEVFDNLLGNAIKFTDPPGKITLEALQDDLSATIRVRDTGQGVSPAHLSRIFEVFEQGSQDQARTAGGLGMGLALARGLVELHDGTIEASSAGPGQGTEFVVRLPLTPAPVEPDKPVAAPGSIPQYRILLIEDNADAALMLHHVLELAGHEVSVARTGEHGIALLRDAGADVVLCDLDLPAMSGYDFVRLVRADDDLPQVPIVALSGYGRREDRKRSAEAGFDDHLVKPIDADTLIAALARAAKRRK